MFMLAPIAYRLDSVVQFHAEINKWELRDSDVASVRCPSEACSAKYGLLFPWGISVDQKTAHIDCLIQALQYACPAHPEKFLLAKRDGPPTS